MSKLPIMPVFTDALIGDTTHLSTEEFGAYCLILIATWRNNGKAFPDDDNLLSHVTRVTRNRWLSRLKPRLNGFFDISDGYWHQKRLELEWKRALEKHEKQSIKGKQSAAVRALKYNDIAPTAVITEGATEAQPNANNHKPDIIRISPIGESQSARQIALAMIDVWNREIVGTGLRSVTKLREPWIPSCRTRFKNDFGDDLERWRAFVRRVTRSSFLLGNNRHGDDQRPFKATFDWVLKPRNLAKIEEGNYDNDEPSERRLSEFPTPKGPPPKLSGLEVSMEFAH